MMFAYVLRRLLLVPIVLISLSLMIFAFSQMLTPMQRLATYITNPGELREGQVAIERLIEKYGLDDPFLVQYGRWLRNLLAGNLGWSQSASMPVADALGRLLPASLELAVLAIVPVVLGGIFLGTLSAVHHNRAIDHTLRLLSMMGLAFPSFVFGLVALMIFYGRLGWFPPGRLSLWALRIANSNAFHNYTGMHTIDSILNLDGRILLDALRHLVLPVLTLAIPSWAGMLRIMRSSMLETLKQDYVSVARAKGQRESVVIRKHARRNSLLPIATVAGLSMAYLMGGVVITETIFNYNGLGMFAARAAATLDFPAVLGFALLFATLLVLCNLLVDLLYAFLDPRIRIA